MRLVLRTHIRPMTSLALGAARGVGAPLAATSPGPAGAGGLWGRAGGGAGGVRAGVVVGVVAAAHLGHTRAWWAACVSYHVNCTLRCLTHLVVVMFLRLVAVGAAGRRQVVDAVHQVPEGRQGWSMVGDTLTFVCSVS